MSTCVGDRIDIACRYGPRKRCGIVRTDGVQLYAYGPDVLAFAVNTRHKV